MIKTLMISFLGVSSVRAALAFYPSVRAAQAFYPSVRAAQAFLRCEPHRLSFVTYSAAPARRLSFA